MEKSNEINGPLQSHNVPSNNNNNFMHNNNSSTSPTIQSNNTNLEIENRQSPLKSIAICATVSFIDIKSASKALNAEHKLDDRVLTTEYYEPSSLPSRMNINLGKSIQILQNNTITSSSCSNNINLNKSTSNIQTQPYIGSSRFPSNHG